jgi:hypothetical protein
LRRMEGLSEDCETMADAGLGAWELRKNIPDTWSVALVFGQILSQWPQMFRVLDEFRKQTAFCIKCRPAD